jgi:transposase
MPAKGFLNQEQTEKLQQAVRQGTCPLLREHALILLLYNDGKTYQEIQKFIGCGYRTVAHWCVHGDPDNLESLRDKREQGNYRKATKEYIELLLEVVEKAPSELGYEFGRWTTARLSTYLQEQTGIKLSSKQISRILQKKKYVYIWAKYSLEDRQDKTERGVFRDKLKIYLKAGSVAPDVFQVWFWDETGFSLRVLRRKCWTRRGQQRLVSGKRSRGRVNVMGGLRYHDRKRLCFFVDKGNADSFLEQLVKLNDFVKQEWTRQGNSSELYERIGPRVLVILDNASYHKRQDIIDKIEQTLPNIHLCYLPAYSPDFNLIELVWHSCKEFIAHRLFQSVEQLKELLKRLLNDGDLVINWNRKLRNKGNGVVAS